MNHLEEIDFVAKLTEAQAALRLAISLLMGSDGEAAKDVLQETNIYLWTHADSFDPGKGTFLTWARN